MIKLFGKKDSQNTDASKSVKEAVVEVEKKEVVLPEGRDALGYSIIRQPLITEKASNLASLNRYVFKVLKESNKVSVRKAVGALYKVKVEAVRIVNLPAKKKQVGRHEGLKPGYKKAIVTLKQGQSIDVIPK